MPTTNHILISDSVKHYILQISVIIFLIHTDPARAELQMDSI